MCCCGVKWEIWLLIDNYYSFTALRRMTVNCCSVTQSFIRLSGIKKCHIKQLKLQRDAYRKSRKQMMTKLITAISMNIYYANNNNYNNNNNHIKDKIYSPCLHFYYSKLRWFFDRLLDAFLLLFVYRQHFLFANLKLSNGQLRRV